MHVLYQPSSSKILLGSKDRYMVENHRMGTSYLAEPSRWLIVGISSMPSTHASGCTFFAVSVLLSSFYLPLHSSLHPVAVFAPFVVVPWTCMIALSRVWLGYHTWPQVVGGVGFGVCFASLWFKIWVEDIGRIATLGREVESLLYTVTSR